MSYGNQIYGEALFGSDDKSVDIDNDKYIDLMDYLPDYYQKNKVMISLQFAIGKQLYKFSKTIEDFERQMIISTATWGLSFWEKELKLQVRNDNDYESRREIIRAKLRGRGSITIAKIKELAETFSGGECDVIEHNNKYYFIVKFVGHKGVPKNLEAFKAMIKDIRPSHIGYKFEFILITYSMLNKDLEVTHEEPKSKNITYRMMKEYRVNEINDEEQGG